MLSHKNAKALKTRSIIVERERLELLVLSRGLMEAVIMTAIRKPFFNSNLELAFWVKTFGQNNWVVKSGERVEC